MGFWPESPGPQGLPGAFLGHFGGYFSDTVFRSRKEKDQNQARLVPPERAPMENKRNKLPGCWCVSISLSHFGPLWEKVEKSHLLGIFDQKKAKCRRKGGWQSLDALLRLAGCGQVPQWPFVSFMGGGTWGFLAPKSSKITICPTWSKMT
jgi:hypothetical protein